jgi:hypothetical protein
MFKVIPILPPKGTMSAAKFKRAIQTARGIAETAGLSEARGITRGWKHRPDWKIERKGDDESHIVTSDEIFYYQDQGTKGPYPITPRRKRALFWKGAAHPVRRVTHPGLKAQRFTDIIAAKMQKQYQRIMDDVMRQAAP